MTGVPKHIRKRKRFAKLMHDQQGLCLYCKRPVREYKHVLGQDKPDDAATIDHVVPRCAGGNRGPKNAVLACQRCNREKAAMSLDAFLSKRNEG